MLNLLARGAKLVSLGPSDDESSFPSIMSDYEKAELVFSILSVAGSTAACAEHGDAATVDVLASYYSLVAQSIRRSDGRVIKVIGDGVTIAFPVLQARACGGSALSSGTWHEPVAALRSALSRPSQGRDRVGNERLVWSAWAGTRRHLR